MYLWCYIKLRNELTIWYNVFSSTVYWVLLAKKQRLGPKLEGGWARGASKKIWDTLRIFATVEASNFKFGTQIGFGTTLPKNGV